MTAFANFFSAEPFDMMSVTQALMLLPFHENRLGELGLFESEGVETTVVSIDEEEGQLQIMSTRPRGAPPERKKKGPKRKARLLEVPHLEMEDRINASSIQNDRVTGEIILKSATTEVNKKIVLLRQDYEDTMEVHRLGAMKGILLDADGDVIFDYFDEFEKTPNTVNFDFTSSSTDVRNVIVQAKRLSQDALGGSRMTGHIGLCGRTWFDQFVAHENVKDTYRHQQGIQNRTDLRDGFVYAGIQWEEYTGFRNLAGDIGVIDDDEAFMVPTGVPDLYKRYNGPHDFMALTNLLGTDMIAKVAPDTKWDKWVDCLVEGNPLHVNRRPNTVIKLTRTP